jgi:hypothetical protein
MRSWTRLATIAALGAGALLGACGGGKDNPDARPPADGRVDAVTPDGAPDGAVKTRSATLAVTEVKVTTAGAPQLGGASISLSFDDLSTNAGGEVLFGNGSVGSCTVLKFTGSDGANVAHPNSDEGPVTITNTLLPTGQCAFLGDGNYHCITDNQTGKDGAYSFADDGTKGQIIFTVTGTTFTDAQVGMYMTISGLTDTALNGTWPVVGQGGGSLVLVTPTGIGTPIATTPFTGAGYTLLQGEGPVPGGDGVVDFLDDGTTPVRLQVAANTDYPDGIDVTLAAEGQGMALADPGSACTDCAQPTNFPINATSGTTVTFSCDDTADGGDCGADMATAAGMVVTGTATSDPNLSPAPFIMPDPKPGVPYVTFSCTAPLGGHLQIPAAAVDAINSITPTRVETRVFRFAFSQSGAGDLNDWSVVVGHGIVGHTQANFK